MSHVDAAATLKGIVFLALQNRTASANDTAPAAPNARAVNVALASSLVDVIASARASRNRERIDHIITSFIDRSLALDRH